MECLAHPSHVWHSIVHLILRPHGWHSNGAAGTPTVRLALQPCGWHPKHTTRCRGATTETRRPGPDSVCVFGQGHHLHDDAVGLWTAPHDVEVSDEGTRTWWCTGLGFLVAVAAVAAVSGGLSLGRASAAVGAGARTTYVPITPCRLIDTRPAPDNVGPRSAPLAANDTFTIDALPPSGGCPIPATATALQLNVTAVDAEVLTFLTIWPSDVPGRTRRASTRRPGRVRRRTR